MAGIKSTDVVDYSEENVFIIRFIEEEVSVSPAFLAVGDEWGHINDLREVHPGGDLLVKPAGVLEPFQVEGRDDRKFLKCELLGAFLVAITVAAPDLTATAQVLGLGEPLQAVGQTDRVRVRDGGEIQRDVPERINGRGDSLTYLTDNVTLEFSREDGVDNTGTGGWLDAGLVYEMSV